MSASESTPPSGPTGPVGEILIYQTEDGQTRVDCRFADESLWLTQALIAELYQVTPQNITQHLKALFEDGELEAERTCKDYLQVQTEGGRRVERRVKHYNLDAVLAVGYRVRSTRGTQFRRWATGRLREYLVKGFVMDDERLKNPPVDASTVPDYFDELLERIRDIRASERRMYLRVRDILALAADYAPSTKATTRFFQTIQNKLHYGVHGQTAAELVIDRADAALPNMGLNTWTGSRVTKTDVNTAKNYLTQPEIRELNRIVVMWLDYAEDQAKRRQQILMDDWVQKLDAFLAFNERDVLPDAGSRSRVQAKQHAEAQYEQFAQRRRALAEAEGERDIAALAVLKPKQAPSSNNDA